MKIIEHKTSLLNKIIIGVLGPLILAVCAVSFITGFLWGWIYWGFVTGDDVCDKITGYETREQRIRRLIKQNQQEVTND